LGWYVRFIGALREDPTAAPPARRGCGTGNPPLLSARTALVKPNPPVRCPTKGDGRSAARSAADPRSTPRHRKNAEDSRSHAAIVRGCVDVLRSIALGRRSTEIRSDPALNGSLRIG
jgi:hypothetical protein